MKDRKGSREPTGQTNAKKTGEMRPPGVFIGQ